MTSRLMALRTIQWQRLLRPGRMVVSALLLMALAVGGVLAMRQLRPAAPAQIMPGQALAWDIARAASHTPEVQVASGSYLPGTQLLLYTRTTQTDRARVRTWALLQLEPFAERLATLPASEKLTWVIDFGAPQIEQEVIVAPLTRATEPALYSYVSSAPNMLSQGGAAPVAAQPTTAPATQPTAAPAAQPTAAQAGAIAQPTAAQAAQPAVGPTVLTLPNQAGQPLLNSEFNAATDTSAWLPLAGDWAAHDGIYSQRDNSGYDFMSIMNLPPQANYDLDSKLRLGEGDMGGGFVYNAPSNATRAGAQLIDFDNKGGFLRWGRYDTNGAYIYEGGAKVDPPINDGQWHDLHLSTRGAASSVSLDGRPLGTIANTSTSGYAGLLTSKTKVDFDNVTIQTLPGNGAPPPTAAPVATPATVDAFADNFNDGDAKGWQVLSGTWQNIEQQYQQTAITGSDLGTVSMFQGAHYSATVQLKRLDGDMGGGLYFNMDKRDSKSRSQMVSYTQSGKAIQWGHFDEGGNFVFEGSAPTPDGSDNKWHTLNVRVNAGKATFTLDDKELAKDVQLAYTSGYVGLLTSNSKVAFDNIQIATEH